jgi:LPS export ABC transporter protein LptC
MTPRRIAKLLAWLGSAVLATILIGTVWVVRHRVSGRLLQEAASVVPGSLLSARNFHWTQMKGDSKQWELSAGEASFAEDKKSLRLKDADLSMVTNAGQRLLVHAPFARLSLDGNHVRKAELSGGLEVHYGTVVVTVREAAFTPDEDTLEAPGTVAIEGQGFKVTGIGLTAHPHEEVFDLHSQVSTEVQPRPGTEGPRKLL